MTKPRTQKRKRRIIGSRQYADYSDKMLELAAENVRLGKMSSYEAEKMFNIPRRTILNRANNKHTKTPGGQIKLTVEEEKQFVNVLIAAADFGSPLTELDLRIVVYEYLKKYNKEHLFKGKMPGRWWVKNFLDRYKSELTTRITQNIKKVRAEKTVCEFEEYFENLEASLKDVSITNIVNFDETNFSDNPGNVKCIFKRSVKYPERIMNFTKGAISVMYAATASGDVLPPYTVYKAENMWNLWRLSGPRGSRYNSTKSGWFDSVTFQDWFETVILPWAKELQGTKVIIGDNLSSHVNVEIFKRCQENDIKFVFLPANSTHLSQPLDVSFFGPLKKEWRKVLSQYKIDYPQNSALNKADFPGLLKTLMANLQISNKENVMSGFRTTGIAPFDPAKVLRKLPAYEENIPKYNIDETLLSYLKAQRTPKATGKRRNQKIAPGKSVEALDIEEILRNKNAQKKRKISKDTSERFTDSHNAEKKTETSTKKGRNIAKDTPERSTDLQNTEKKTETNTKKERKLDKDDDNQNKVKINSSGILDKKDDDNKNKVKTNSSDIALDMDFMVDNLDKPSTSATHNSMADNTKKITVIQEEVLEKRVLSKILKDVNIKTLKRKQTIGIYNEDSDTDFSDNISFHESEDSPIEDMCDSEEDKEEIEIHETYMQSMMTDNFENIEIPDEVKEIDDTCEEKIGLGSFLLVKFTSKKSTKFYIGEVIVIQEVGMTVKFLRKKTNGTFVWPIKEDIGFVLQSDIESVLPSPQLLRRGMYKFKCNFNKYNVG